MADQTAMMELIQKIEKLRDGYSITNPIDVINEMAKSLLEKEKEQIKDAFKTITLPYENANDYYNQTYKQKP